MLAFPQLSSGAIAQLPWRRESAYRTLVNRTADGREIRLADLDYFSREWELPLELLTDAEWQAIQDLFTSTVGRLKSFLFLEPGENLLAWSEKFNEAVWVRTGVAVADGTADPFGGTAGGQISGAGTLSQSLSIPAKFKYAASMWARTTQSGASLQLSDGASQTATASIAASGQWSRYLLSTAWSTTSETVLFTVNKPAGAVLDIYGPQLDAQPSASNYKRTLQRGGAHPGARFASDTLGDRATAPGKHSGVIRVSWTPSLTP